MRTIETNVYTYDELSEEAKENALNNYRAKGYSDDFWNYERVESYNKAKEIYSSLENIQDEISGGRLVAWIQNNLSYLWTDISRIGKHKDKYNSIVTKRRNKNGFWFSNSHYEYKYNCLKHRTSKIFKTNNLENCPLTGVCYDYDFLQPIIDFMKSPKNDVTNLDLCNDMPTLESISERDYEYQNSDDFISEEFRANDYEFTEDGKIF